MRVASIFKGKRIVKLYQTGQLTHVRTGVLKCYTTQVQEHVKDVFRLKSQNWKKRKGSTSKLDVLIWKRSVSSFLHDVAYNRTRVPSLGHCAITNVSDVHSYHTRSSYSKNTGMLFWASFLNNSMLAYREWYVAHTNQIAASGYVSRTN